MNIFSCSSPIHSIFGHKLKDLSARLSWINWNNLGINPVFGRNFSAKLNRTNKILLLKARSDSEMASNINNHDANNNKNEDHHFVSNQWANDNKNNNNKRQLTHAGQLILPERTKVNSVHQDSDPERVGSFMATNDDATMGSANFCSTTSTTTSQRQHQLLSSSSDDKNLDQQITTTTTNDHSIESSLIMASSLSAIKGDLNDYSGTGTLLAQHQPSETSNPNHPIGYANPLALTDFHHNNNNENNHHQVEQHPSSMNSSLSRANLVEMGQYSRVSVNSSSYNSISTTHSLSCYNPPSTTSPISGGNNFNPYRADQLHLSAHPAQNPQQLLNAGPSTTPQSSIPTTHNHNSSGHFIQEQNPFAHHYHHDHSIIDQQRTTTSSGCCVNQQQQQPVNIDYNLGHASQHQSSATTAMYHQQQPLTHWW